MPIPKSKYSSLYQDLASTHTFALNKKLSSSYTGLYNTEQEKETKGKKQSYYYTTKREG